MNAKTSLFQISIFKVAMLTLENAITQLPCRFRVPRGRRTTTSSGTTRIWTRTSFSVSLTSCVTLTCGVLGPFPYRLPLITPIWSLLGPGITWWRRNTTGMWNLQNFFFFLPRNYRVCEKNQKK